MTKGMISKEMIQVVAASILFVLIAASTQNPNFKETPKAQKRHLAQAKNH